MSKFRLVPVFVLVWVIGGCTTLMLPLEAVTYPAVSCPSGRELVVNTWVYEDLPDELKRLTDSLIRTAKDRNTQGATNPSGYEGDAISRTLGARLRKENKGRAKINVDVRIFYRDSTGKVAEDLGLWTIVGGRSSRLLPGDPRHWITEIVFPQFFKSPIVSGGERRLWLFGDEWKQHCSMNVHGIVP